MNLKRFQPVARQHRSFLGLLVTVSLLLGMVGPSMVLPASRVQAQTGTVTLDGDVHSNTADDVNTISISHTTGTGTNRLMLVGVSWNSGNAATSISSVTFTPTAGSATTLTEVGTRKYSSNNRYAAIYKWPDGTEPPSGETGTVTVDLSATVDNGIVAGVANFAGVDQTTPLGAFESNEGTGTNTSSLDVTGLAGDELVFDVLFGGGSTTLTVGADQTELWSASAGNASGGSSIEQAAGSSVTMSWTRGNTNLWVIGAVPINPAAATGPTISISGTPLDAFSSLPGTPSAEQSYTVSGSNLTDDITITAPTDFEISETSGSGFGSSLTLTQSGGDVALTPIYVRFNRATTGTSSGDITHTSSGATQQNVAVSGTAAPITLDGTISSGTADGVGSIDIPHTTGTGTNRLMLVGVSANSFGSAQTISSVTFGYDTTELSLTEVGSVENEAGRLAAIYGLVTPPSGQAGTVTVTFSGSVNFGIVAGVANFAGVNQATPYGAFASATGQSTAPSVDLTGLDGDELVFDTAFVGAATIPAVTVGADQTEHWNTSVDRTGGVASTEQATGSSVTMSWTAGSSVYWSIGAVPINPAPTGPTQDLTIVVNPSDGGTTSPTEGVHTYPQNEVVDITAAPNAGYLFSSWSGDCTGTDPDVCQVLMDADKTVTANFEALPQYALAVNVTGNGGVTLDPGGGLYSAGTTVTLTPVPDACYAFGNWSGPDVLDLIDQGDGTWSMTMDAEKSVTANFVALAPGTPCYRVNCGGDALDMVPDPDFEALHFDALDAVPGLTVSNVDGERSTTNTIDMTNVDPGLPMELFQTVLYRNSGAAMTFDFAVPNGDYNVLLHHAEHNFSSAGQRIFDIFVEGVEVLPDYDPFVAAGGQNIAVTENVPTTVSDGVLTLAIAPQTSVAIIRGIEIVPSAETGQIIIEKQTDPPGAAVSFEFSPSYGANFSLSDDQTNDSGALAAGTYSVSESTLPAGWSLTSATCDDGSDPSDIDLDAGETVTCTFVNTQATFTLDYAAGLGGTLTGETQQVVPYGGDGTAVEAVAATGYVFVDWSDGSTDNPRTDTNVMADVDVTANFARILGDVNGDGSVNSTDALIALSCDAGLDTSEFCPMNCGDVNDDDVVDSTDALIILSYDVNMEVPFPLGEAGCPASVTPCGGCGAERVNLSTEPRLLLPDFWRR